MEGHDLRLREGLLRGERRGAVVDIRDGYISHDESDNPPGFEFPVFGESSGGLSRRPRHRGFPRPGDGRGVG